MAFGDYQIEIYLQGLVGIVPSLPMAYAEWEAKARAAMAPSVWSYVAGGAGDERTQRVNVTAFERWGLMPRMFVGAKERDLSVELFGMPLPSPVFMAPIGVIGLCAQDGHGDLASARAAARTGVPMITSTLTVDPLEDIAAEFGDTPGFFQLYTPTDRELAASLVQRAEAAGYKGIVVTLDTWVPGWRPRDLSTSNFPQLRGHCLSNYLSDPVFRASLPRPPEEDPQGAVLRWVQIFGNPLSWDDLPWLRSLTTLPLIVKGICHPDDAARARRRRGRHLLLQPRRPPGQRRYTRHRLPARRRRSRRRAPGPFRLRYPQRCRHRQSACSWRHRCRYREAIRVRACAGWRGRRRPRAAFSVGRGRPEHGRRRRSHVERPHPRSPPARQLSHRAPVCHGGRVEAILEEFDEHLALERGRSDHTRRAYLGDLRSLFDFLAERVPDAELDRLSLPILRSWLAAQDRKSVV